ncbi:hypothetical protein SDC9_211642 [bioreactor metagenome]|uniref:Uncharacterized protein n=1 Tax=bioreactor metagenome TaxID=1076179 RepID=A0A645JJN4_9ZZZZ
MGAFFKPFFGGKYINVIVVYLGFYVFLFFFYLDFAVVKLLCYA